MFRVSSASTSCLKAALSTLRGGTGSTGLRGAHRMEQPWRGSKPTAPNPKCPAHPRPWGAGRTERRQDGHTGRPLALGAGGRPACARAGRLPRSRRGHVHAPRQPGRTQAGRQARRRVRLVEGPHARSFVAAPSQIHTRSSPNTPSHARLLTLGNHTGLSLRMPIGTRQWRAGDGGQSGRRSHVGRLLPHAWPCRDAVGVLCGTRLREVAAAPSTTCAAPRTAANKPRVVRACWLLGDDL